MNGCIRAGGTGKKLPEKFRYFCTVKGFIERKGFRRSITAAGSEGEKDYG